MQTTIIDDIRPNLSHEDLLKRLHIGADSPQAAELADLVAQAERIGRPKAISVVLATAHRRRNDHLGA